MTQIVYLQTARKAFLTQQGNVDWQKVQERWNLQKKKKTCLGNKWFTPQVKKQAEQLAQDQQQSLLNVMMGGLCNDDSSVGVYATTTQDYQKFAFYFQPLIRQYHGIQGDIKQKHDWNIPINKYLLTNINPKLTNVSMRARVARNAIGWNLPPCMSKQERIDFQETMVQIFGNFDIKGRYYSLTPGHKNLISNQQAEELRNDHRLYNDVTTDNHLTSSGVATDWPFGRGMWMSDDKTKIIWVGQQDHLRIISIVNGYDLGAVDKSLHDLITKIQSSNLKFAQHQIYGVVTTCPTNMGTSKRQSILGKFPNISLGGTNQKKLKEQAKKLGLQARGIGGEHSAMDKEGTADISPSARFGITQAEITQKLYNGLVALYAIQSGLSDQPKIAPPHPPPPSFPQVSTKPSTTSSAHPSHSNPIIAKHSTNPTDTKKNNDDSEVPTDFCLVM